jgi:hypothetical protein
MCIFKNLHTNLPLKKLLPRLRTVERGSQTKIGSVGIERGHAECDESDVDQSGVDAEAGTKRAKAKAYSRVWGKCRTD